MVSTNEIVNNTTGLSAYFAQQFAALTPWKVIVALLMGFAVGMVISFVYKRCYRGVLYSPSFGMTLVMLTLITTPVVMCIKSDLSLSMGMVGALSIVRFRTAVKDPADTAFLFWAVAAGITSGAGFYLLTVIGCAVAGLVCLLSVRYMDKAEKPFLLILRTERAGALEDAEGILYEENISFALSSCMDTGSYTEAIYEMGVNQHARETLVLLKNLPGIISVSLVDCRKDG